MRDGMHMPGWITLYTIAPTFTVVVVRDNTCDARIHHIASVRRAALYFRETFASSFGGNLRSMILRPSRVAKDAQFVLGLGLESSHMELRLGHQNNRVIIGCLYAENSCQGSSEPLAASLSSSLALASTSESKFTLPSSSVPSPTSSSGSSYIASRSEHPS